MFYYNLKYLKKNYLIKIFLWGMGIGIGLNPQLILDKLKIKNLNNKLK